jgi:hypothetical protein
MIEFHGNQITINTDTQVLTFERVPCRDRETAAEANVEPEATVNATQTAATDPVPIVNGTI